jgi:excisionase family DNA binding protein
MAERLFKVEEAAENLGFAPYTVRKWLRAGRLRGVKSGGAIGRSEWRVPESALSEFVAGLASNQAEVPTGVS